MLSFGEPWPDYNDGIYYRDILPPSEDGVKLIFYARKYQNSAPLLGWLQRIQNKQVTIDGCIVVNPNTILSQGADLVYHRLPWKEPDAPYLLGILYEDDDVIALNKPSELQVLPGELFQQRTVLTQLQRHTVSLTTSERQEPNSVPIHRLGRGTSGILLCAKTKLAKSRLAASFADGTSVVGVGCHRSAHWTRQISRCCQGIACCLIFREAIFEQSCCSREKYTEKYHIDPSDPLYSSGGQPKCSDHQTVDESFSQDGGYQKPERPVPGDCGYHLHAHHVAFLHPVTNEQIEITAPLPSILQTLEESAL